MLNGAAAIHDAEVALPGSTSEDVGAGLFDGTYGSADETGRLFAEAPRPRRGGGDRPRHGARPHAARRATRPTPSAPCCAPRRAADVPVTVHVAIGTDTVHMHPACDGAALGAATHRDFLRLAALVEGLDGGVYVNVGSAVVLPEVFMKAVAMVHNARAAESPGADPIRITTGQPRHAASLPPARERARAARRRRASTSPGHHELNVPLLRLAILGGAAPVGGGGVSPRPLADVLARARRAAPRASWAT